MLKPQSLVWSLVLASLVVGFPTPSSPQDNRKEAEAKKAEVESGDGAQQFCANIANLAADARIAWQMKRLGELDAQMKQRIAELEAKEAESKDWISRREAFLKKAADDVVAIYAKMRPDAAAAQMVVMDETTAAALLTKLNPRVSSAILNEMEAGKAAKLTDMMSGGAPAADRKKS
jgi:flagellar motility protein MotE (MotC chaperone)